MLETPTSKQMASGATMYSIVVCRRLIQEEWLVSCVYRCRRRGCEGKLPIIRRLYTRVRSPRVLHEARPGWLKTFCLRRKKLLLSWTQSCLHPWTRFWGEGAATLLWPSTRPSIALFAAERVTGRCLQSYRLLVGRGFNCTCLIVLKRNIICKPWLTHQLAQALQLILRR